MSKNISLQLQALKDYFSKRDDILMAFVFGSRVTGRTTLESDFDIAVYFKPKSERMEYEDNVFYEGEGEIWNDIEKILRCKTDFVVLNRAPATLAFPIVNKGKPIIIKDRGIYLKFLLIISSLAIDFREFMRDFRAIKARSIALDKLNQKQ